MSMASGYVSQQDIAERAGVHITTVSLALRDNPRLPLTTRQRIQGIAQELGYRPDPMLSALTVYRERLKRVRHQGTLAWIYPAARHGVVANGPFIQTYRNGAEERCRALGYKLENFSLSELKTMRLSKILRARNIQGLLIPPQSYNRSHMNFDWENFSAVCFGFTLARPRLHLVANAQYRSARIAVRAVRAHGYRRIGFAITHTSDERTDQNFSSGFLSEQRRFRASEQLPILIIQSTSWKDEKDQFEAWYREHRPEMVLHLHPPVMDFLRELGIGHDTCGVASLCLETVDGQVAGIFQNDGLAGHRAVDFVIGMIHRNERGIPPVRSQLLIDGSWVDGKTLPSKNALLDASSPFSSPALQIHGD